MNNKNSCSFQYLIQSFFQQRLMQHKKVSGQTINSYRDTFKIYFEFLIGEYRCTIKFCRCKYPISSILSASMERPILNKTRYSISTQLSEQLSNPDKFESNRNDPRLLINQIRDKMTIKRNSLLTPIDSNGV